MSDDLKLPNEIMVWRGQKKPWTGTWATTRYPDDAVAYVPRARIGALTAEVARLTGAVEATLRPWEDTPDDMTAACQAAHPHYTKNYPTFVWALELVSNRHGKYALVGLVNYLLARAEAAEAKLAQGADEALERAAQLIESTAYTTNGDVKSLEPVSPSLFGMDMHHATIAAAIRALKGTMKC